MGLSVCIYCRVNYSAYTDLFCLLSTINRSPNTNQVLRSTSGHPVHTPTCSASYLPSTDHQTLTRSSGQHLDIQSSATFLQFYSSISTVPLFSSSTFTDLLLKFYRSTSTVLQFYRSTDLLLQLFHYTVIFLQFYTSTSSVLHLLISPLI